VEFQLTGGGADQVSGRVTDGNWVANVLGDRAAFHTVTNRAPFAGKFTVILPKDSNSLPAPAGNGFGTVSVAPGGAVVLKGRAADGSTLAQSVPVSLHGSWPFYVSLYGGKGSLLGWLTITNRLADDVNGLVSWIRPPIATSKYYSTGFTNELQLIGSTYVPPISRTNRVFAVTNGVVMLADGNLSQNLLNLVVLSQDNHVMNLSSNKLTLSISTSSGAFSGTEIDLVTRKPVTFRGVILQKQNYGSGYFLGTNQSGQVYFGE
jgi:hypothetical protein